MLSRPADDPTWLSIWLLWQCSFSPDCGVAISTYLTFLHCVDLAGLSSGVTTLHQLLWAASLQTVVWLSLPVLTLVSLLTASNTPTFGKPLATNRGDLIPAHLLPPRAQNWKLHHLFENSDCGSANKEERKKLVCTSLTMNVLSPKVAASLKLVTVSNTQLSFNLSPSSPPFCHHH